MLNAGHYKAVIGILFSLYVYLVLADMVLSDLYLINYFNIIHTYVIVHLIYNYNNKCIVIHVINSASVSKAF